MTFIILKTTFDIDDILCKMFVFPPRKIVKFCWVNYQQPPLLDSTTHQSAARARRLRRCARFDCQFYSSGNLATAKVCGISFKLLMDVMHCI